MNRRVYGDDYIEPVSSSHTITGDIDAELDMLSFELESEEEVIQDGIIDDEADDETSDDEYEESEKKDEYEYDDVDPEIFKDAERMVKWLEKSTDMY